MTKARDVKVGDTVRYTLGDEWQQVVLVECPTPDQVRITLANGEKHLTRAGTLLWRKP